jgi:hypothetical protein
MARDLKRNGQKYEAYQIEILKEIIRSEILVKGNSPLMTGEFTRKLHTKWIDGFHKNPFYRKTPKVFATTSAFFIQTARALRAEAFPRASFDDILLSIYHNVVVMSPAICSMPDVYMSEASRILLKHSRQ